MKNKFVKSLVTSSLSILPIIAIVFILSLTNIAAVGNNFARSDLGSLSYISLGIGAGGTIASKKFYVYTDNLAEPCINLHNFTFDIRDSI